MSGKNVMIVSIDSKTEGGQNILDCMQKKQDGWLRAEWVARENYAPTVQLERAEEEAKSWRTIAMNHLDEREKAEAENARLREYVATVAKYCVELGYQVGHEHTVDGHYAPPSEYDYDIFNGINLMEVDV